MRISYLGTPYFLHHNARPVKCLVDHHLQPHKMSYSRPSSQISQTSTELTRYRHCHRHNIVSQQADSINFSPNRHRRADSGKSHVSSAGTRNHRLSGRDRRKAQSCGSSRTESGTGSGGGSTTPSRQAGISCTCGHSARCTAARHPNLPVLVEQRPITVSFVDVPGKILRFHH